MEDHDQGLCAQLGHFVGSIAVVYCPHHQHWLAVVGAGDDADDIAFRHERIDWGPFDSTDDVVPRLQAEVSRLVRIDSRAWLATRQEDDPTE